MMQEPTAAFNDIKTNNRAALRWPSNVTDICASIGLIPFVPNELEDVALIKQILRIITQNVGANQISAQNALFPIAVTSDDKDNRLLGLDLKSDVCIRNSYIKSYAYVCRFHSFLRVSHKML